MTAHTVYALTNDTGRVVYIGCTSQPRKRFRTHRDSDRVFSKFVPLRQVDSRTEALKIEEQLIVHLDPEQNCRLKRAGVGDRNHGTATTYSFEGCRCNVCVAGHMTRKQERSDERPPARFNYAAISREMEAQQTTVADLAGRCGVRRVALRAALDPVMPAQISGPELTKLFVGLQRELNVNPYLLLGPSYPEFATACFQAMTGSDDLRTLDVPRHGWAVAA